MSLLKNMGWTALLQAINLFFPILILPLLFRYFSVSDYGLILTILSIANFSVVLVDFGTSIYFVRLLSVSRHSIHRFSFFVSAIISIRIINIIILSLIFFAIYFISGKYSLSNVFSLIILGAVQSLVPFYYFQSIENNKPLAFSVAFSKLLITLPLIVFFSIWFKSVTCVIIAYSIGHLYTLIFGFNHYRKNGYIVRLISFNTLIRYIIKSFGFFYSRLSVASYTASNTAVVGFLLGNHAAAAYGTAEKIYSAIRTLYTPVSNAIYPYMAKNKNKNVYYKVLGASFLINIIGCVFFYFILPFISGYVDVILLSENYIGYFIIALIYVVPSILIGYPFLGAFGYANYVNVSTYFAPVVFYTILGMNYYFFDFSIYSFLYAIMAVEFYVFVLRLYFCKRFHLI